MGHSTWGREESDTTERLTLSLSLYSWLLKTTVSWCYAGRDWGQEEKGTTEDEMAGWHHRLDGRESEQTLGDGGGQRSIHRVTKCQTQLID